MNPPFVPEDFTVPTRLDGDGYRLEPLGPEHNERDHAAWMSSIDHIRATPGFEESKWPVPMSLEANLADLERHARDFANREGFTYSILAADDVIGCVYIYPARAEANDADVSSWVSERSADMDARVWRDLSAWLVSEWPFSNPDYAAR